MAGFVVRFLSTRQSREFADSGVLQSLLCFSALSHPIAMPGRFPEVDSFGREVDPTQGQYRANDREGSFDHRYGSADRFEDDWSRRRHRSYSSSHSRSRSRSHRRHHERKAWEVPFNPLALAHEGDHSRSSTRHRHRHHHHHHHHHHESDSDERRDFTRKNNTPADKKERWGHELYIENVRTLGGHDA